MAKDLEISMLYDFYGDLLTEKQQEVIRLRFFENLSQREVAERTGVSQMSVSRTERSALEQLRRAVLSDE